MSDLEVIYKALCLACEWIADGPQQYHEANTPDGWRQVFITAVTNERTVKEVIAERPETQKMNDAERARFMRDMSRTG